MEIHGEVAGGLVTYAAVGRPVAPRIGMRRLACSMTAKTYMRTRVNVTVPMKSAARKALTCERRKSAHVVADWSGARPMPRLAQDPPDRGPGDLHPEHEQFAVIRRYPQLPFSRTNRNTSMRIKRRLTRPAAPPGTRDGGMATRDGVVVPLEGRVSAHQQPQAPRRRPQKRVQQRSQQHPVGRLK
ncbi:hypothetical protein [Micromonospora sp. NPDC003776]